MFLSIPEQIATARLQLRKPTSDMADAFMQAFAASLPELDTWFGWGSDPPTTHESVRDMASRIDALWQKQEYFAWRVFLNDSDTMVGNVDLHSWDWDVPRCEIGFWGRTDYGGHGYMTEAVTAVLERALTEWGVQRVEAISDARNIRAHRVLERAGMAREGIMRNYERDARGVLCDQVLFARVPPTYPSQTPLHRA